MTDTDASITEWGPPSWTDKDLKVAAAGAALVGDSEMLAAVVREQTKRREGLRR